MNILCFMGIHARVLDGGGGMGDALCCVLCGRDKYPEVFGIAVKKRMRKGSVGSTRFSREKAWREAQ